MHPPGAGRPGDAVVRWCPYPAGTVKRMLLRHRAVLRAAKETDMGKTALGMPKRTLVQSMGASSAAFGVACLLAPQALGKAYRLPSSPHTTQLFRHSGTRTLALAAWTFTARTQEETDRVLAVAAAMNVADVLIALATARTTGATAVRAAATRACLTDLGGSSRQARVDATASMRGLR